MSPISRTQAWCKLAVLIAEGLPAPMAIDFHPDGQILSVTVDSEAAFHVVAAALGTSEDRRRAYDTGDIAVAIHNGVARWNGFMLNLTAYIRRADVEPPVTEDMSRVREVAEHGEDEPRCPDPECGEPLALIASGAVGHCGRSCASPDEETARVEEDAAELASHRREAAAEFEAERHAPPAEVMDEALRTLAVALDRHPELLDNGAVSGG